MNVDIPVLPAQSTGLNCTPQGAPRKTSKLENKCHVQVLGFFREYNFTTKMLQIYVCTRHTVLVMAVAHCKWFLTVTPSCISAQS